MSSTTRHTVIPAVHLVLWRDNQVLLARRFNTGYQDGKYSVPAGHADQGETVWQAMIRETKEEIGLDISQENFDSLHVMHRYSPEENKNYLAKNGPAFSERVDFFFLLKKWSGEPEIMEPNKCDELRWVSWDTLPEKVIPYVGFGLQQLAEKKLYSELGWNQ